MSEKPSKWDGIGRRTVLKGLGASAIGIGGTGLASAHHVQDLRGLEGVPSEVRAGESFSFDVLWESGHGGEACFVAAIGQDGNWTQVGQQRDTADGGVNSDERTSMTADIPEEAQGTYTFRLSATEWATRGRCPDPGETADNGAYYVRHIDRDLEVRPAVEVQDVSFRGCGQVWVAFETPPEEPIDAEVNIDGEWNSITISPDDLTTIPGQYGDTPVFRYRARGGKLVGIRVAGEQYDNDNRCAQNV